MSSSLSGVWWVVWEEMDLFPKRKVYYYITPSSIRPAINHYIFAHRPLGSARKTRPSMSISLSTMQRRALRIASIVGVPVPEARIVGIPDENRVSYWVNGFLPRLAEGLFLINRYTPLRDDILCARSASIFIYKCEIHVLNQRRL
jgi:hypothetical protein